LFLLVKSAGHGELQAAWNAPSAAEMGQTGGVNAASLG
jgi:hypothetical protein